MKRGPSPEEQIYCSVTQIRLGDTPFLLALHFNFTDFTKTKLENFMVIKIQIWVVDSGDMTGYRCFKGYATSISWVS